MPISKVESWFHSQDWEVFPFQKESWESYVAGMECMVNAPTGSGKTYAAGLGLLADYLDHKNDPDFQEGIQCLWITPIRALAKEIESAMTEACQALDIPWSIGRRTGDTSTKERAAQLKKLPHILITTPESLQLLLASKNYAKRFKSLKLLVNDEWHEILGSKRAVQMELAHSRLKSICSNLRIWGVSATVGNMEEAMQVMWGNSFQDKNKKIIKANIQKRIELTTILPEKVEELPWAGHLGISMLEKVIPVIKKSKTTLIFTNTRSQAEIWYQQLLESEPDLAGELAMHHGSIARDLREWVEEALHAEKLKAVVCTSSLDLGVDFRPVETIVQIGSPKGVARFMQRAGRSGHQPGAISNIYFVPTHSLEIIESAALGAAMKEGVLERRIPYFRSFDVLIQYLVTLAVSDGFYPNEIFKEVKGTFSFESISEDEWNWVLDFIVNGGQSLDNYEEFKKVEIMDDGLLKVNNRRIAMRHRLSIGTIVGESIMKVKYLSGKFLGTVEEYFISRLLPGDVFWFSGRNLELVQVKGMEALVRKTKVKKGKVPAWGGGRMPLSSQLSSMLRIKIRESLKQPNPSKELSKIAPLIQLQSERSHVPTDQEFLIEYFESKDGYHAYFYPFEGRFVHEGMASVIAYRIGLIKPITFSIALNDYGFELLSDQPIPLEEAIENQIFTEDHLFEDIQASVNSTEMARRKFRDIASISGLVFKGFPGNFKKDKHLQSSSQLFFEVFKDYESDNLLFRQAFEEVMEFQLEETRMREAMSRIEQQSIILQKISKPSPFSFPIMVDRLREKMSTEKLADRVKRMKVQLERT